MKFSHRNLAANHQARRGSLLVELALSAAMLMIAMGLTVKVLGWVGAQRRNWDRRQVAVQEAANLMERLTARPFASLTPESTRDLPLSARARQSLPKVELKVDVRENDKAGGADSKRVAIARAGKADRVNGTLRCG